MIDTEMFSIESVEKLIDKILLDKNVFNEELIYPIKDVDNREILVVVEHKHDNFFHLVVITDFSFDGKHYNWDWGSFGWTVSDDESKDMFIKITMMELQTVEYNDNMKYSQTIYITKKENDKYQRLLDYDNIREELLPEMYDVIRDKVHKVYTAVFDNNYFADVKVCAGSENCYVDIVLFNDKGCELDCTSSEELLGPTIFEINGDSYEVDVKIVS